MFHSSHWPSSRWILPLHVTLTWLRLIQSCALQPLYNTIEALPGVRTCSLVPLKKKMAFSLVPQNQTWFSMFPISQKCLCSPVPFSFRGLFPCSPEINGLIYSPVPQNPWEGLTIVRIQSNIVTMLAKEPCCIQQKCLCLFVLRSYGPVNPMGLCRAVFQPGISVLGPRGPYPPKCWGHLKKSEDSTINNQNFIENVPVAFRCGYFAPCNLFL